MACTYTHTNYTAPVHYFELEPPPQQLHAKNKQKKKPAPKELPGEKYILQNSPGCPTKQKQKVLAVSLLPSITQYSNTHTKGNTEWEKAKEKVPIYSIKDKSKKSTKMVMEPKEQEERETKKLSCAHTLDSFFNTKSPVTVKEGGDTQLGSSSPPPPLLPPKPGQKSKQKEDDGKDEESVYAEASSKPLQVHSQRKTKDKWSDTTKHKTATEMGNISPFHLHTCYYQKEQGHIHKRSLSAIDHMKRKEAHSQLPAKTEHDQLYDTALSLLESKEEEEERLHAQLLKNEERI